MRERLLDDAMWNRLGRSGDNGNVVRFDTDTAKLRDIARRVAAREPTADELAAATARVQPALDRIDAGDSQWARPDLIFVALLLTGAGMSFFPGLASILLRPSGVVVAGIGLAVLRRNGREVGRLVGLLRWCVAWSPMLGFAALIAVPATRVAMLRTGTAIYVGGAAALIMLAGALWTAWRVRVGPHDRIVRTSIGVR
jgi:hypothetical protein